MIDFHSHLDLYPDGLKLAQEVNRRNEFTLVVTTSPRAYRATSHVFLGLENIKVGIGLHPEVAAAKQGELDDLIQGISRARFVGEIGMDGSPRFRGSLSVQERVFQAALAECGRYQGKVMSIHSRGAARRVVELLATAEHAGVPVLHWFSGGFAELETAVRIGCWFSVGPAMLEGERGRALVARMPLYRVLPETDGPFTSVGGIQLQPWDAWSVRVPLATIWGMQEDEVGEQLKQNLHHLLQLSG
ncbi:Qat anti-phage system TatD family nuclease QatD [Burkholderia contaminans]|uniref:TatD family hydrolase n=1 Tax=Burkholderia contaminans TaxID=488447 RepID=A0AAP4VLP1_9BURK|nr:Qat anti-phage system TatD family nuclease QatD [Burkholderia contaminans]MDN7569970.1 TatD family hydrolase [Burkholderia contaminans]